MRITLKGPDHLILIPEGKLFWRSGEPVAEGWYKQSQLRKMNVHIPPRFMMAEGFTLNLCPRK